MPFCSCGEEVMSSEAHEHYGQEGHARVEEPVKGEVVTTAQETELKHRAATQTENEVIEGLRANLSEAVQIEARLLQRLETVSDKELPAALRAAADSRSKSLDGLMKMTGRDPTNEEHSLEGMLLSMSRKGFVRLNVSLEAGESA